VSETDTVVFGVAERYATALFELARDTGELDKVAADIDRFEAVLADSADLRHLIKRRVFTPEERGDAIAAVAGHLAFSEIFSNFLKLVTRNDRLFVVADMMRGYRALLSGLRGEVVADVSTAVALSGPQVEALKSALSEVTGKSIRVAAKVDEELIGGLVVRIGSRMIDTSLKTKLDALKIALKEVG
jgi:F-type H+-transporting ATPase subunit delta